MARIWNSVFRKSETPQPIFCHQISGHIPDKSLENLWRPYLIILKIFGLYHSAIEGSQRLTSYTALFSKIYSIIVIITAWYALVARFMGGIAGLGEPIAIVMALSSGFLWHISHSVCLSLSFWACYSSSRLPMLFRLWNSIESTVFHNIGFHRKLKTLCGFITLVVVLVTPVHTFVVINGHLCRIVDRSAWTMNSINMLFRIYHLLIDHFIVGFIAVVCLTLVSVLSRTNYLLSRASLASLADEENTALGTQGPASTIGDYERLMADVLLMVDVVDGTFRGLIGTMLSTYILLMTVNTYTCVHRLGNLCGVLFFMRGDIYWMLHSVAVPVCICCVASAVHSQVNQCYKNLCKVSLLKHDTENKLLIISLQNRLGSSSIGLTFFGIDVITKKLLLSAGSVYLTYVVILFQFVV